MADVCYETSQKKDSKHCSFIVQLILLPYDLTPNRPLIHTSFTYPKLNMDNFSGPGGPLGYGDST